MFQNNEDRIVKSLETIAKCLVKSNEMASEALKKSNDLYKANIEIIGERSKKLNSEISKALYGDKGKERISSPPSYPFLQDS